MIKRFEYRTVEEDRAEKKVYRKLLTVQIITLIALILPIIALFLYFGVAVTGDRGAGYGYAESLYFLVIVGINLLIVEPLLYAIFGVCLGGKAMNIGRVSALCAGGMPLAFLLVCIVVNVFFAPSGEPYLYIPATGLWFVWLYFWTAFPAMLAKKIGRKNRIDSY